MSTARCRSALAYFFISTLLTVEPAASEIPYHAVHEAELEADLARTKAVYLVVGLDSASIAIRARGVTLESFPITSAVAYENRRFADSKTDHTLEIPRVFAVAATISLIDRKVVAPETLRPWSDEPDSEASIAKDDAPPVAPSSYDVPLDGGWVLEIRQEDLKLARRHRLANAAADGWARLTRNGSDTRGPTLRLVIEPAAAAKVHHLFRKGTKILVTFDGRLRGKW